MSQFCRLLPILVLCYACCVAANDESSQDSSGDREIPNEHACSSIHFMRAGVRYKTPEGIGYRRGYSSAEIFSLLRNSLNASWFPFVDVRGHIFDNGKMAANAGVGLRYLGTRIWGINAYYDYRDTRYQHYNQVAAGLETLGSLWDLRMNAYFPVGEKQSPFRDTKFYRFSEHNLILKSRRDFVLKGSNAEIGFHVRQIRNAPFYFAAGPYYLTGKGSTTWGGQIRAEAEIFRHLRIEGNLSYDHFYKWIGQAEIGLTFPLGKKSKAIPRNRESCTQSVIMSELLCQRINRFEIIPTGQRHIKSIAMNPATHEPWVFWFVNNLSHSLGTFEDPFSTLLDAQNASLANQAIYVFPGDGTTQGMDQGIMLKDAQLFLGASVPQTISTTLGIVVSPPLATTMPSITNPTDNVVTLANDNTVSGFMITTIGAGTGGLYGVTIDNLTARQSIFTSNTFFGASNGILLIDPSGTILVSDNTFSGFHNDSGTNDANGIAIVLNSGHILDYLNVYSNTFQTISSFGRGFGNGGNGLVLMHSGLSGSGTVQIANIANNDCIDISGGARGFYAIASIVNTLNVSGNRFSDFVTSSSGVDIVDSEIGTLNISNNSFSNYSGGAYGVYAAGATISEFNSLSNRFSNFNDDHGIFVDSCVINELNILKNSFDQFENVMLEMQNSTIANFNIGSNNFLNIESGLLGVPLGVSLNFSLPGNSSASVINNIFVGGNGLSVGYAATITVSDGILCLSFKRNTATPQTNPAPYQFTQSGGTFNRTSGSDNSTNVGEFSLTGSIGNAGTCAQ